MPVNTVAAGGLAVVESTSGFGTPVSEAAPGRGVAVTKVIAPGLGLPVVFDVVTYATLNGTTANVVLSNGGLTVTANSVVVAGACSGAFKSTGKYYFEVTCTTISSNTTVCLGLITSDGTLNEVVTSATNCFAIYKGSGNLWGNGVNSTKTLGALSSGNIICVAVDLTARLGWMRKGAGGNWNGDVAANPATGVNGVTIEAAATAPSFAPVLCPSGTVNDAMTANLGASAFTGAVPSGFTSGWPA